MAQKVLGQTPPGLDEAMEKISPTEELCIEHAMLDRILLAMNHTLTAKGAGRKTDLTPFRKACDLITLAVDKHHMKIEEEMIYPEFTGDRMLGPVVSEFKVQHDEARKMVARMDALAKKGGPEMDEIRRIFMAFHDMITAHAAMEETMLFTAMQGTWSDGKLDGLKGAQEADEEKLLGKDAPEKLYGMLGDLESSAGIRGIKDFTRRLE